MRHVIAAAGIIWSIASSQTALAADSCSSWKAICRARGNTVGCDTRFPTCLRSGCWTEGARYGGATHCGLTKK